MMYTSIDTGFRYAEEDLDEMGYIFVKPSMIEKESKINDLRDSYQSMLRNEVVKLTSFCQKPPAIKNNGSTTVSYEKLMETIANSKSSEIHKKLSNQNAKHIAQYDGLKTVAAILDSVSEGLSIGQDRKWKRSDGDYTTHHGIFPVVAFNNVGDAIKFIQLLRAEHPTISHIGYTDLKYCKLALNDRESDYKTVDKWDEPFKKDTMINVSLGRGYRFSISCPHQRQILEVLNNISEIPEISRIKLFVDYCRRTAPKRVEK